MSYTHKAVGRGDKANAIRSLPFYTQELQLSSPEDDYQFLPYTHKGFRNALP